MGGASENHSKGRRHFLHSHTLCDSLLASYPHSQLRASGENVGLPRRPDGQLRGGPPQHRCRPRVVYQDLVKINKAIREGSIMDNAEIKKRILYAKESGKAIHFMGLTSDGGVHSSLDHLFALCDICPSYGLEKGLHPLLHGWTRHRSPLRQRIYRAARSPLRKSAGRSHRLSAATTPWTATSVGKRVKIAYDLLVNGEGARNHRHGCCRSGRLRRRCNRRVYQAYPQLCCRRHHQGGRRCDLLQLPQRPREELTTVLTQHDMPEAGMHTIPGLSISA